MGCNTSKNAKEEEEEEPVQNPNPIGEGAADDLTDAVDSAEELAKKAKQVKKQVEKLLGLGQKELVDEEMVEGSEKTLSTAESTENVVLCCVPVHVLSGDTYKQVLKEEYVVETETTTQWSTSFSNKSSATVSDSCFPRGNKVMKLHALIFVYVFAGGRKGFCRIAPSHHGGRLRFCLRD
jgi:hypothetical protein